MQQEFKSPCPLYTKSCPFPKCPSPLPLLRSKSQLAFAARCFRPCGIFRCLQDQFLLKELVCGGVVLRLSNPHSYKPTNCLYMAKDCVHAHPRALSVAGLTAISLYKNRPGIFSSSASLEAAVGIPHQNLQP